MIVRGSMPGHCKWNEEFCRIPNQKRWVWNNLQNACFCAKNQMMNLPPVEKDGLRFSHYVLFSMVLKCIILFFIFLQYISTLAIVTMLLGQTIIQRNRGDGLTQKISYSSEEDRAHWVIMSCAREEWKNQVEPRSFLIWFLAAKWSLYAQQHCHVHNGLRQIEPLWSRT